MDISLYQTLAAVERDHWWFVARRRLITAIAELAVPVGQGNIAIDIGCGTGGTTSAFSDRYNIIGLDENDVAIACARSTYPHVDFRLGRFPADVSDVVGNTRLFLLLDVLEHIADDRAFVDALLGSAAAGAHILVTVPADMALWSPHDEIAGHHRRYDAADIRRLFDPRMVDTRLLAPFNKRLYPLIRLVRMVKSRLSSRQSGPASDIRMPNRLLNTLLREIFSSETESLKRHLDERPSSLPQRGVSLMALFRRRPVDDRRR